MVDRRNATERLITASNERRPSECNVLGAAIAVRLLAYEHKPLLVATTKRLSQRTMEATRPTPAASAPGSPSRRHPAQSGYAELHHELMPARFRGD
jgi:hypothetical protein